MMWIVSPLDRLQGASFLFLVRARNIRLNNLGCLAAWATSLALGSSGRSPFNHPAVFKLHLNCDIVKWFICSNKNIIMLQVNTHLRVPCSLEVPVVFRWQLRCIQRSKVESLVSDRPNEYSGGNNVTVRSHVTRMDTLPRWDT